MTEHWSRCALVGSALLIAMLNAVADDKPAQPSPAPTAEQIAACTGNAIDREKIVAACGVVIGNDSTPRPDRIAALLMRARTYAVETQSDNAIADYSAALTLDPFMADALNARGELWRGKGDRPRALADFGAAIKADPQHIAARANYKSLALELEKIGADMALKKRPTSNCAANAGPAAGDCAILPTKPPRGTP